MEISLGQSTVSSAFSRSLIVIAYGIGGNWDRF
jgi:hypothetical protein